MESVKLEESSSVELNTVKSPHHPDEDFVSTMPLQEKSSHLNDTIKNDI